MYKRILVPIDGSDTAALGLREAIKLARDQGGQIRIVHVVNELPLVSTELSGIVYEQLAEQLRESGTALLTSAEALVRNAGVPVDTQLVELLDGQAGEYVVGTAKDWPADIIVCGTHGRRGLRRIVMGSDAEFIVRHSPVPILLIRSDGQLNK